MAELNTGGGGGKGGKVRSKKSNPGVDLTAMVDLAFLLITFFILTTTLSKPQSMDLALPDKDKPKENEADPPETPAWRTFTVVMGKDNKVVYYIGMTDKPYNEDGVDGTPKVLGYGGKGIRKAILAHKEYVAQRVNNPEKEGLTVLIKAYKSANYKNVVDILDEMAITKPRTYAMVDITPGDVKMLEDKGIK
ncbi:ExbD/TolR family protein [Flavobacterium urocaniciphilum]|uniref:Outer membrane transport energization protein ExbD n=1 Tax=Flavobacterium urocaniciphilum TaxID=1299341 RepID=A0A1H9C1X0_9FLAO|nr:biopolymer transporter ExbD [Flavobacterium urocaniciphilum]SEP95275.1 outer membrane transport energization protein ExbD [Flavobacterium urocaniciphilum]